MSFTTIVVVGVVIIAVLLIFDTKPGAMLKGLWGMFFEDMAQTPEGAKAIYQKAQEDALARYTKAKGTLEQVAGQCSASKRRLAQYEENLQKCEASCELFAKKGDDENLTLYADQRIALIESIKFEKSALERLEPAQKQAQEIVTALGEEARRLEREKNQRITELQMSKDMQKIYASMDELAADSEIDKLLKATQKGAEEAKQRAEGAKIVHENSLDAKLNKAEKTAARMEADAYIEQLKSKVTK